MGYPEKPWYAPMVIAFLRDDVPSALGMSPSAFARDVATLERRLASEGESFLTKTLPSLGKSVDLALQGHVPLTSTAFRKKSKKWALPAFLWGLTRRVFLGTGWVMDEPCLTSLRLLRQICNWCKKIEKGYSDESLRTATEEFISLDRSLPDQLNMADQSVLGFARSLIQRVLGDLDLADLRPKHGPGSVAGKEGVIGKRDLRYSYKELERVFRPIPWFRSLRDAAENPQCVYGRPSASHGLSRTEFVEKDSSGPRIIGLEPAEYMWCQQALKSALYNHIEFVSPWTKGQVNFSDQGINRRLTSDLWYDTLDMSKASDRNSLALVEFLFKDSRVWPYMLACRTPGTVLPSGDILWFKKFAPMGSALCFPTMALTFFAIAVGCLHIRCGIALQIALKHVFVYGDDLIVPHGNFEKLSECFSTFSIKFNENKCCIHGKFRESCGMDSFGGVDVTPTRFRKAYAEDATGFIPIVEHHNALVAQGYYSSARQLREAFYTTFAPKCRALGITIPYSKRPNLQILHWLSLDQEEVKLCTKHSITTVRGWVFQAKKLEALAGSEARYLREVLSRGGVVGNLYGREPVVRKLDARYTGKLVKKRVVYNPQPPVRDCWLQDLSFLNSDKDREAFSRLVYRIPA